MTSPLPSTLRGKIRTKADLSATNWFRVGGPADILFRPADAEDLAHFLEHAPGDLPITVLGVGSNVIVRDGGIDGVVIKLGGGFTTLKIHENQLIAGAACLDLQVAEFAAAHSLAGLEFLSGIPGTIGGALRMNAGAYGTEIADVLVEATAIDGHGTLHTVTPEALGYRYRHCEAPADWIFTQAVFRVTPGEKAAIVGRITEIRAAREATQPIRERTGGSTFKNPEGAKAWELIDAAGCRGLTRGEAKISEQHCNFMINTGAATAEDLEALGEEVRARVKAHSGITLEWEIKRIGNR